MVSKIRHRKIKKVNKGAGKRENEREGLRERKSNYGNFTERKCLGAVEASHAHSLKRFFHYYE